MSFVRMERWSIPHTYALTHNDELFIKYKSMSLATLCHKHIFTANITRCIMHGSMKEYETESNEGRGKNGSV